MVSPIAIILPLVLASPAPERAPSALAEPLKCWAVIDDGRDRAEGKPFLVWATATLRRVENLGVSSNGYVALMVQYRDAGLIDCRARLTPERVESFKQEIGKTNVWRLKGSGHQSGAFEVLKVHLDGKRRCDMELSPERWAKSPATRAVQKAIERLKADICGGSCPEPEDKIPSYDRVQYLR